MLTLPPVPKVVQETPARPAGYFHNSLLIFFLPKPPTLTP
jgi:hypothetical protein